MSFGGSSLINQYHQLLLSFFLCHHHHHHFFYMIDESFLNHMSSVGFKKGVVLLFKSMNL